MTKRVAAHQMTQENCMDEEEHEEAGHFEQAAAVKLQNREIKKAKRRIENNGVSSSPFSQFAGFAGASKTPFPSFTFHADTPKSNGQKPMLVNSESKNKTITNFGSSSNTKSQCFPAANELSKAASLKQSGNESETKYLEKLRQLNVSFLNWIQEHMNKNQYCDFTPVCTDYVEHMKKLECPTDSAVAKPWGMEKTHKSNLSSTPSSILTGKSSINSTKNESAEPRPAVSFSFLAQKDGEKSAPSSTKPFAFSSNVVPKTGSKAEGDEEENYVPPKNEFQLVKEQDALYSKRCKLFYKKGENYVDKGVGTLYLKKDKEKIQLIVRADTSTGLILLNICLNSSLPIQRVGKNNVLIVCIPNPPLDQKSEPVPTPFLFRVKASQDADDLFENLNKHKC